MRCAYRKRGSKPKEFAEMIEPSSDTHPADPMKSKYPDGSIVEVPQITVGEWRKDPGPEDDGPPRKRPSAAQPSGAGAKNIYFRENDLEGKEVVVRGKWNREKGRKEQRLIVVTVDRLQIAQVDIDDFGGEEAAIEWCKTSVAKVAASRSLSKGEAYKIRDDYLQKGATTDPKKRPAAASAAAPACKRPAATAAEPSRPAAAAPVTPPANGAMRSPSGDRSGSAGPARMVVSPPAPGEFD
eukprot:3432776-Pyramimonas_sp.AAC.1